MCAPDALRTRGGSGRDPTARAGGIILGAHGPRRPKICTPAVVKLVEGVYSLVEPLLVQFSPPPAGFEIPGGRLREWFTES